MTVTEESVVLVSEAGEPIGATLKSQVHTLATAAVARLEQEPVDRERGETRLRWSSAGCLPVSCRRGTRALCWD